MFVSSQPRGAAGLGSPDVPTLGEEETSSPSPAVPAASSSTTKLFAAAQPLRALLGTTEHQGHPQVLGVGDIPQQQQLSSTKHQAESEPERKALLLAHGTGLSFQNTPNY